MEPIRIKGIMQPEVAATVQGSEALQRWRQRQLHSIYWCWGGPALALLLGVCFGGVGAWPLAAILVAPAAVGLCLAPGLSVVYGLRYRQAGRMRRLLPQLPRASVVVGRVAALPAPSSEVEGAGLVGPSVGEAQVGPVAGAKVAP